MVTAPEPLRPMPVTASQFGVADMPVIDTWACAGATNHKRQIASSATRLCADDAKAGAAKPRSLSTNAGGKRMSRISAEGMMEATVSQSSPLVKRNWLVVCRFDFSPALNLRWK
jgi:hypothetical protein